MSTRKTCIVNSRPELLESKVCCEISSRMTLLFQEFFGDFIAGLSITFLGRWIGKLRGLRILAIDNTGIRSLPLSLCDCGALEVSKRKTFYAVMNDFT